MSLNSTKSLSQIPAYQDLKTDYPELKTLLFDMDGTLFNTEKYHAMALKRLGQELKIKVSLSEHEVYELMVGKADHLLFEIIKTWPGFPQDWPVETFISNKNNLLLTILKEISYKDYFSESLRLLLKESKKQNILLGLVTSSEKIITHELLKMSHTFDYFDFILTRDDSLKVKPDPWPYLYAMKQLNSASAETLIFEDSKVGIEAATRSGAIVMKANWY